MYAPQFGTIGLRGFTDTPGIRLAITVILETSEAPRMNTSGSSVIGPALYRFLGSEIREGPTRTKCISSVVILGSL